MLGLPHNLPDPSGLAHCLAAMFPLAQQAVVPQAGAGAGAGTAAAGNAIPQLIAAPLLFLLAVAGAVGTILLLPGAREASFRKIGGAILFAVAVIFAAVLARAAGGMGVYFWIFSGIAVVGAVRVITHPKPVYSALYFVLTVMASAGLFVLMWAEFMAAALILIYAGAILVTYVFVIMLAAEAQPETADAAVRERLAEHDAISREPVVASAVGFALLGVLLFVIFDRTETLQRPAVGREDASVAASVAADQPLLAAAAPSAVRNDPTTRPTWSAGLKPEGSTQLLGQYLFEKQLVNLELAGLILTVAMVGAIVIARKRVVGPAAQTTQRDGGASGGIVVTNDAPINDSPHSIPVYGTENPRQKEYPET